MSLTIVGSLMTSPKISAYIPCFNNESTIQATINSIVHQTIPPSELYKVDEGSTELTVALSRLEGVEVLSNGRNFGRGYTVLKPYAGQSMTIPAAMPQTFRTRFHHENTSSFQRSGRFNFWAPTQCKSQGTIGRWRSRHLFKRRTRPQSLPRC